MANRQFDPLEFTQSYNAQIARSHAFKAQNLEEAKAWQASLKKELIRLLGGFPEKRCALGAEVIDQIEIKDGIRETVLFQSREGMTIYGYFLKPRDVTEPLPAVLALHGHGRGVDDIVGIEEDGNLREEWSGVHRDYALQALSKGYAVLAIEQFGFGHRRDAIARKAGAHSSSCQTAAGAAFLFGQTMIGWRVWDVMRSIDYLETRPEVDASRIACMGLSGGGTTTLHATALEPRIKVGVVSGYFNRFADCIMAIPHCIDNFIPGVLNVCEMPDIAGLVPPRALFVESGTLDPIFPIEAFKTAVGDAQRIYDCFGIPDKFGFEIFEDEHVFFGKGAFEFLKRWL